MINKRGICSTLAGLCGWGKRGKKGDLWCYWLELKANPGWFTLQNKCKGGEKVADSILNSDSSLSDEVFESISQSNDKLVLRLEECTPLRSLGRKPLKYLQVLSNYLLKQTKTSTSVIFLAEQETLQCSMQHWLLPKLRRHSTLL